MTNAPELRTQVSRGLNLWLKLEVPERMDELLAGLLEAQPAINAALQELNYVHFARFLPTPDKAVLQVITSFDGEFDAYVLDFLLAIADPFEFIMGFMENRPPSPVKDHPAAFLDFIRKADLYHDPVTGRGLDPFSAYPQHTVIDIIGAAGVAPAAVPPEQVVVDRTDVQANLLRGVGAAHAIHLGLRFGDAAGARSLLSELLDGVAAEPDLPTIGSDATRPPGTPRPSFWLTVGFSHAGLLALGISEADREAFELAHRAFVRGPHEKGPATAHGDTGPGLPARWRLGGRRYAVDLMISLYADDPATLELRSQALRRRCALHRLSEVGQPWVAQQLEVTGPAGQPSRNGVHFGYLDGLSQPRLAIEGDTPPSAADDDGQPRAGVGEFLLGGSYPNVYGGRDSLGGLSPDLAENASFAAVRVMAQDVAGFEDLLDRVSTEHGVDREWLAAKLMGRWRHGTPVSQSPDTALADAGALPPNRFDYRPAEDRPGIPDDAAGLRCPVGAHVRRMNPRNARVAGRPYSRRLLRRGMPYGPAFVRGAPDANLERGLFGIFVCADLDRQFEFLLRHWAQGDRATTGILGEQDPLIGAQAMLTEGQPMTGQFRIPRAAPAEDLIFTLPRLTWTVGSVYLFIPGLAALRRLAKAPAVEPLRTRDWAMLNHTLRANAALAFEKLDTDTDTDTDTAAAAAAAFDPRDESFRDDPFLTYTTFRKHQPVAFIPKPINSVWVFSHEGVKAVAEDLKRFRKRASSQAHEAAGLLFMDPEPHTHCRAAIQPLFNNVLADVKPVIAAAVRQQYATRCQGQGQAQPLDWMTAFAKPIAQQVFFELLGLGLANPGQFIRQIEHALATVSPADDPVARKNLKQAVESLAKTLYGTIYRRVPGRLFDLILKTTQLHDANSHAKQWPATALEVEQLAITVTLALPSFLPLQWFIALAIWHLLDNDGVLLLQIRDNAGITNRAIVDELLRFDMSTPMSDRHVVADGTVLGGLTLAKDQRISLAFASANRDEAAFGPHADRIDFNRNKGPGWAFGPTNEHHCLGAPLVYAVMEPVIQVLREADPLPRLSDGFVPVWDQGAMFRPMVDLMVHS